MPSTKTLVARVATEHRRRNPDPERIATARRELAAQQVRDAITRILSGAPPLLPEQRAELAALVLGEVAADASA